MLNKSNCSAAKLCFLIGRKYRKPVLRCSGKLQLALASQGFNQSRLTVRKAKKSPNQETGLGNRGRLKVLNVTKLILKDELELIQDQFGIIQSLQTFPIPQTSFVVGTFFDASYSKTAFTTFGHISESDLLRIEIKLSTYGGFKCCFYNP